MSSIDTSPAALRALAKNATRGPWRVSVNRMPYSFVGQDGTPHVGEHIERHIVTVRDHPQSKAPDRIVTRSIGVGYLDEPPISMVYIRPEDADYLAAVSPDVVMGLLDSLATVRASLLAAEESRDAAKEFSEWLNTECRALKDRAEKAEAERDAAFAHVSRLKKALEPIATAWDYAGTLFDRPVTASVLCTVARNSIEAGHFRTAKAIITEMEPSQ